MRGQSSPGGVRWRSVSDSQPSSSARRFGFCERPANQHVVARELGIPRNRIYKWAEDADKKGEQAFRGAGRPKASMDELAVLQRENARLKEENEILKKAAAYFAKALP